MPARPSELRTARAIVAHALIGAAEQFPDLDPQTLDTTALEPRDARLALALHRTVLQRWLTLEYVLELYSRQPMRKVEPALRAVLLSGAAQLLFMTRLPVHAVVDESVSLARRLVRPGAAGLVNAVLRRVAELPGPVVAQPWIAAADRLPVDGGYLGLRQTCLPDSTALEEHLAVATSHPRKLVQRWLTVFGPERTTSLCLHNTRTPPVIVAVEEGFVPSPLPLPPEGEGGESSSRVRGPADTGAHSVAVSPLTPTLSHPRNRERGPETPYLPHSIPGFLIWTGSHEALVQFLAKHPQRRVQDPAASRAVAASASLKPRIILDYCAGRGTKTRQLAALHPEARIFATDPAPARFADLQAAFADQPRVTVAPLEQLRTMLAQDKADLILLDVPCSNTAVLARRPEARYRLSQTTLDLVVGLQRKIIEEALPLLAPGGRALYSTCSIEEAENQGQVQRLIKRKGAAVVSESLLLPEGEGPTYHDGGYHALLKIS